MKECFETNFWEPQTQGEFTLTYKLFSTALHCVLMRKIRVRVRDHRESSSVMQARRRGVQLLWESDKAHLRCLSRE